MLDRAQDYGMQGLRPDISQQSTVQAAFLALACFLALTCFAAFFLADFFTGT
jgi:hypothetical protein